MVHKRIYYITALLVGMAFYVCYREWLSWLLLVGLMGLPWLSLLVSLPPLLTFRGRIEAPAAITAGTPAVTRLEGDARMAVPRFGGWLRLEHIPTGETRRLWCGGDLSTDHCGGIRVTVERAWVYDSLDLFRFRANRTDPVVVKVRPQPLPMGELPDLSRFLALRWRPKPGGGYAENHELRLYRPGDSLNQVHWKLTAKTGKLTIREAMEPDLGLVLLTLDVRGTAPELDRKFGRLLWLGRHLTELGTPFEIRALTGEGIVSHTVKDEQQLLRCIDRLLCCPPAAEGSVLDGELRASWHRHLGGEPDEA